MGNLLTSHGVQKVPWAEAQAPVLPAALLVACECVLSLSAETLRCSPAALHPYSTSTVPMLVLFARAQLPLSVVEAPALHDALQPPEQPHVLSKQTVYSR